MKKTIKILAFKFNLNQANKLKKTKGPTENYGELEEFAVAGFITPSLPLQLARLQLARHSVYNSLVTPDGPRCSAPWSILPWGGAVATAQDSPSGALGNAPQGIP
ncbi:hypothetical protein OUZ56_031227 [Daphnia magna]|uniref:Uncharacterized protein n=1 Tax=Daphnia magna TaxID=35525 RepID=A0ABQ9ZTN2_9CRUS|nr:hypothetical protein OUZ56_031227 [Daphnia magna]